MYTGSMLVIAVRRIEHGWSLSKIKSSSPTTITDCEIFQSLGCTVNCVCGKLHSVVSLLESVRVTGAVGFDCKRNAKVSVSPSSETTVIPEAGSIADTPA